MAGRSNEEYPSALLRELDRLRRRNEYCDIEIHVKDSTFRAHKLVLASSSLYFKRMLCGPNPAATTSINLEGFEPDIFEELLNFMYSGKLAPTDENVQDLIVLSDMFSLSCATEICNKFLNCRKSRN